MSSIRYKSIPSVLKLNKLIIQSKLTFLCGGNSGWLSES